MTEKTLRKKPYPLGAHREGSGIRFSFVSRAAECGILLYDRTTGRERQKIPFEQKDRIGNVYCRTVTDIDADSVSWLFYEEDRLVADQRGRAFPGRAPYGKPEDVRGLRAAFPAGDFDWGEDSCPRIPYHQAVAYCLHVRGFTRHTSSGVRHKGTFAGIMEKIPYLKEIGVTTLELQPAYEFTELPISEELAQESLWAGGGTLPPGTELPWEQDPARRKLNYWGYKRGFYYAPKAAYAASEDPAGEFRALVRELHRNRMELVMQFYFPGEIRQREIADILHFWVLEYHVDGFHLMGGNLAAEELAADELLAGTKLWYYRFDTDRIYGRNEEPEYPHVGEYNDSWYYDMRRFLKGDGGMLDSVLYHMRHIPARAGDIHYISNYYGFTLADLVSYDRKHNEQNGEENRDGNDYNCSWNCGEEGTARRKKTRQLRTKQMRNAMCLLLFSQSTPLLFMGDEFGNSQKGNNNPYCQDNATTWLDWELTKKNSGLLEFWKSLAVFRREHSILHPARELRLMDYMACGYPDLSYHGQNAWQPRTDGGFRHIGMMFCGKYGQYGQGREETDDSFLYLAMNMDWTVQELALPKLPKGMEWRKKLSTEEQDEPEKEEGKGPLIKVGPRTIAVYVSSRPDDL